MGLNVEIINTGTELLLGRVLNTHQQWLGRQLADHGYPVTRQVTVSDSADAIREAVREALHRADLVIATGGLGPTSDDRTRDCIAELLSRKLQVDNSVLAHIESFFAARKRPMPATTRVQALVPEGAVVLPNAHGTAPGLVLEIASDRFGHASKQFLVMLPGPPRELRPMFTNQVLPLLEREFPLCTPFACRTLKTTGLGESLVEERIAERLQHLTAIGLEIGYCARVGEVDVRLAATGPSAEGTVAGAELIVRELLSEFIFSGEDDLLEAVVVRLLTEKQKTVSVAESCTGGLIAHRLTNVPGASVVFLSGLVTYSNQAKQSLLGVQERTLAEQGAVSEAAAKEMAEGVRSRIGSDYALSVTGIAGPTGGSETKPTGTVFIGLTSERGTRVRRFLNPHDRETFKFVTSQQALDLLRRAVIAEK